MKMIVQDYPALNCTCWTGPGLHIGPVVFSYFCFLVFLPIYPVKLDLFNVDVRYTIMTFRFRNCFFSVRDLSQYYATSKLPPLALKTQNYRI